MNTKSFITNSKRCMVNNRSSQKKTVVVQAQNDAIRLCKDCVHYSQQDNVCKVLSIVNYSTQSVSYMSSLLCRTRDDLCGMDAKFYEPTQQPKLKTKLVNVSTFDNDIAYEHWTVAYNPDGSSTICGEGCDIDVYYNNMHLDYVDVY